MRVCVFLDFPICHLRSGNLVPEINRSCRYDNRSSLRLLCKTGDLKVMVSMFIIPSISLCNVLTPPHPPFFFTRCRVFTIGCSFSTVYTIFYVWYLELQLLGKQNKTKPRWYDFNLLVVRRVGTIKGVGTKSRSINTGVSPVLEVSHCRLAWPQSPTTVVD